MSKEFDAINEIYKENEGVSFNMAVLWLMDNGYNNMKNMTDKDIIESPKPNMFAEDFYRNILRTARKLAKETSPYDLLKYCMVNPFLRLDDFKDVVSREKLETMVKSRIDWEDFGRKDTSDYINYLCIRYDCDAEDLEKLGINIPDAYWE